MIRTIVTLDYTNDKVVSGRSNNLSMFGHPDLAFTDVNIIELIPHRHWKPLVMRFYKEKAYLFPEQYNFTIFNEIRTELMGELHVELYFKRMRWTKPQTFFNTPGYTVKLEIIQDPQKRQIPLNTSRIP
jgi:hypothetical protein